MSPYITKNIDIAPFTNIRFSASDARSRILTNLDQELKNFASYSLLRVNILKIFRPSPNSLFNSQNIIYIKFATRLCLGLSHLRERKFKHSFQDTLNLLCNCGMEVESCIHPLLQCPFFSTRDAPS